MIGKVGKVVAIISSGDLKVRYMSENLLCTFCPESVVKVKFYSLVQVSMMILYIYWVYRVYPLSCLKVEKSALLNASALLYLPLSQWVMYPLRLFNGNAFCQRHRHHLEECECDSAKQYTASSIFLPSAWGWGPCHLCLHWAHNIVQWWPHVPPTIFHTS